MTEPEQALERARAAAASLRAQAGADSLGRRTAGEPGVDSLGRRAAGESGRARLMEWALLDPDVEDIRSTRRFGAPITALKRALLRLLFQYHAQLLAQQTRFNVALVRQLEELERRIERLERASESRRGETP